MEVSNITQNSFTKEQSDTIGFVLACIFSSAINLKELNLWAVEVVKNNELSEIPDYIFDLIEFDGYLKDLYKVIGFTPSWERSKEEDCALEGIAVKRGIGVYELSVSKEKALECLKNNPKILESFRKIFPFVKEIA